MLSDELQQQLAACYEYSLFKTMKWNPHPEAPFGCYVTLSDGRTGEVSQCATPEEAVTKALQSAQSKVKAGGSGVG